MARAENLGDYLRDAAGRPWWPAVHDCCAFPARWAHVQLPAYATDDEGRTLIAEAGSLLDLAAAILDPRLARVDEPREGDVGIIPAFGMDRKPAQIGAIYTGQRWAFANPRGGISCAQADSLAVWRVP